MLKFLEEVAWQIDGDVLTDMLSRMLYATDASPYQRLPLAVCRPRHLQDCVTIVKLAARSKCPIILRAAGTSLAGQCVGDGLIVDVSRYMNRILAIDAQNHRATVQPGVVCEVLNAELRTHKLMFGPDPSTSNYCTIGGMAGNNAWGIHSQRYGAIRDNTLQIEAVLSDGAVAEFGPLNAETLQDKRALKNREGDIYRTLFDIVSEHRKLIRKRFPAPDGIARNAGYPLDILTGCEPWQRNGAKFNLAPFLCGTEGTLALITAIQVELVPIPEKRIVLCAHFQSIGDALRSVPQILPYRPAALELIDHHILERTKNNLKQRANRFWLSGNPQAVLLIEFHADHIDSASSLDDVTRHLTDELPAYALTVVEHPRIDQVWALRKAGLGMLMGARGPKKAATGIEDAAVRVEDLAAYTAEVKNILARYETDCVVYGPAGRGTLHLRPELDLNQESEKRKYRDILDDVTETVIRFRGSISAKHGDGRLRAYYLERQLGSEIIDLLRRVKRAFDPSGILNPAKILDAPAPERDLRFTGSASGQNFESYFDWSSDAGLGAATQKCNGAGVCLQRAGAGTMCPSYMATREEKHGTRGRANILRQILAAPDAAAGMGRQHVKDVLDLCLGCKGCKSECPANVDMARMKAEFMQHYNDRHGVPLRSQFVGRFDSLNRYAGAFPRFSNALLASEWFKRFLGLHPERQLPQITLRTFSHWWSNRKPPSTPDPNGDVVLILDPFSEYYEPQIAIAAIAVLEAMNYRVTVTPCVSLGRAQISQGLLRDAQKQIFKAVQLLFPFAENGTPLIGLEPSELLTLRDEAIDLFEDPQIKEKIACIASNAVLFDEFIARNPPAIDTKTLSLNATRTIVVHGHCHQKSLVGMEPTITTLSLIPNANVQTIPSGCCGMAGAFGYEREHYQVSLEIAELVLFPAIRSAAEDALVVATGTSCRHQIADGLGKRAYHPAEILAMAINSNNLAA